jgi:hypothetical protein
MDYLYTSYSKKKPHKNFKHNTKKNNSKNLSGSRSRARGSYFSKKKSRVRSRCKKYHVFKSHKKIKYVGGIF